MSKFDIQPTVDLLIILYIFINVKRFLKTFLTFFELLIKKYKILFMEVIFMGAIIIRTLVIYVLLTFSMRIMGKRQIGELDVSDLVSTLLISELAAIPIDDPDIPLLNAVIPIIFIISLEIIISTIKNHSQKLKTVFDGRPVYIIYKGRLLQNALEENRISLNELLSEMRGQGIFDISDVEYGIIEQDGTLSLFKKTDVGFAHTLIIDGEIFEEAVERVGGKKIIEDTLKKKKLEDIMLLTVNDEGKTNIIKRRK